MKIEAWDVVIAREGGMGAGESLWNVNMQIRVPADCLLTVYLPITETQRDCHITLRVPCFNLRVF